MSHPPEPTCPNCAFAYDDGYGTGRDEARTIVALLRRENALLRQRCTKVAVDREELVDTLRVIAAMEVKDFESPHVARNTLTLARSALVETSLPGHTRVGIIEANS